MPSFKLFPLSSVTRIQPDEALRCHVDCQERHFQSSKPRARHSNHTTRAEAPQNAGVRELLQRDRRHALDLFTYLLQPTASREASLQ